MNPNKIMMMPLAISSTPINELQPGSSCWVLPVSQSDKPHANCPQASTKNNTPALSPMYNGASENEYLVGDWNGDGKDNIGIRRNGNQFHLDTNFNGTADIVLNYGNGTK